MMLCLALFLDCPEVWQNSSKGAGPWELFGTGTPVGVCLLNIHLNCEENEQLTYCVKPLSFGECLLQQQQVRLLSYS